MRLILHRSLFLFLIFLWLPVVVYAGQASIDIQPDEPTPDSSLFVGVDFGECAVEAFNTDGESFDITVIDGEIILDVILGPSACPPGMGGAGYEIGSFPPDTYTLSVYQVPAGPFPADPDDRFFIVSTDLVVAGEPGPAVIPALNTFGLLFIIFSVLSTAWWMLRRRIPE